MWLFGETPVISGPVLAKVSWMGHLQASGDLIEMD